ncbi:hypothetical protein PR048_021925 [Dryococelus australis]|uniref:Uncharacterized protein n=1 Tax=Dryococelus australis TaxID=614101 RepID=A0ABQ9GZK6_9NEOP|nr:hypothetical protein PR048_021925 [Dryococelus australis]
MAAFMKFRRQRGRATKQAHRCYAQPRSVSSSPPVTAGAKTPAASETDRVKVAEIWQRRVPALRWRLHAILPERSPSPLARPLHANAGLPVTMCRPTSDPPNSSLSVAIGCCLLENAFSYLTGPLKIRLHRHGSYAIRMQTANTGQKLIQTIRKCEGASKSQCAANAKNGIPARYVHAQGYLWPVSYTPMDRDYRLMYNYADINCTLVVYCYSGRRQLDTVLQEQTDGNIARLARRGDEALGVPVSVTWGRGGAVVRLLASHLGEPGSIPGEVIPGFRKWEWYRTMPLGFSRSSAPAFRRCSILPSFNPYRLSRLVVKRRPLSTFVPGQQYVEAPFANQSLVTDLPVRGATNRTVKHSLILLLPNYYWLTVNWGVSRKMPSNQNSRIKEQVFGVYLVSTNKGYFAARNGQSGRPMLEPRATNQRMGTLALKEPRRYRILAVNNGALQYWRSFSSGAVLINFYLPYFLLPERRLEKHPNAKESGQQELCVLRTPSLIILYIASLRHFNTARYAISKSIDRQLQKLSLRDADSLVKCSGVWLPTPLPYKHVTTVRGFIGLCTVINVTYIYSISSKEIGHFTAELTLLAQEFSEAFQTYFWPVAEVVLCIPEPCSLNCMFIGCYSTPGSCGIRKVFPYKSIIGSEACRAGLINCDPIAKVTARRKGFRVARVDLYKFSLQCADWRNMFHHVVGKYGTFAAFDASWRMVAQSSPSTVTADNQFTVDIGISVHTTAESNLQVEPRVIRRLSWQQARLDSPVYTHYRLLIGCYEQLRPLYRTVQHSLKLLIPAYYWITVKRGVSKELPSNLSAARSHSKLTNGVYKKERRDILLEAVVSFYETRVKWRNLTSRKDEFLILPAPRLPIAVIAS